MAKKITIKSVSEGLLLVFQENMTMDEIKLSLDVLFEKVGEFFKGASVNLFYEGLRISRKEEQELLIYFRKETEADITCFLEKANNKNINEDKLENIVEDATESSMGTDYNEFYKGTLNSGQVIRSNRNLVIIGDVNPGAEIEADGSIVVLGNLRGRARAGKQIGSRAYVAALNLEPILLEIGGFIARSACNKESTKETKPEIAYIKDNKMVIDSLILGA